MLLFFYGTLTLQVLREFIRSHRPFWMMSFHKTDYWITESRWNSEENVQCSAVITWNFFSPKFTRKTLHSSPARARYGMSLVDQNPDAHSASVTEVMHAILCYIGPRYNGTRLYLTERSQQCWPRSMSPYGVTRPEWVKRNFALKC